MGKSATSEYSTTFKCFSALVNRRGRVKFVLDGLRRKPTVHLSFFPVVLYHYLSLALSVAQSLSIAVACCTLVESFCLSLLCYRSCSSPVIKFMHCGFCPFFSIWTFTYSSSHSLCLPFSFFVVSPVFLHFCVVPGVFQIESRKIPL